MNDMMKDHLGKEEFIKSFKAVTDYVKTIKDTNSAEFDAIHKAFLAFSEKIQADVSSKTGDFTGNAQKDIKDFMDTHKGLFDSKMGEVDAKIASMKDGESPKIEDIVPEVLKQMPEYKETVLDSAEIIANKLESLEGEARLDAKAIKNLPEAIKGVANAYAGVLTASALYSLADVDVSGIAIGQSIKWDGVRWIPYTPSGGGVTSVYNEAPADSGDHTNFTLAHAPATGTLRLYRGGARQSIAASDYTLVTNTITLSPVLQTGEILSADYNF